MCAHQIDFRGSPKAADGIQWNIASRSTRLCPLGFRTTTKLDLFPLDERLEYRRQFGEHFTYIVGHLFNFLYDIGPGEPTALRRVNSS